MKTIYNLPTDQTDLDALPGVGTQVAHEIIPLLKLPE